MSKKKSAYTDRLEALRGNRKQKEFAKIVGVSESTLSEYMNGRDPSLKILGRICDSLNVNANWFLSGEGEMFLDQEIEEDLSREESNLITALTEQIETFKDKIQLQEAMIKVYEEKSVDQKERISELKEQIAELKKSQAHLDKKEASS